MEFFRPTYVEPVPGIQDGAVMSFWFDSGETALPVGVHQSKLICDGEEFPVTVTVHPDGTHEIRSDPFKG